MLRSVTHLQFLEWPSVDCCENSSASELFPKHAPFLSFVRTVRHFYSLQSNYNQPVLLLCRYSVFGISLNLLESEFYNVQVFCTHMGFCHGKNKWKIQDRVHQNKIFSTVCSQIFFSRRTIINVWISRMSTFSCTQIFVYSIVIKFSKDRW